MLTLDELNRVIHQDQGNDFAPANAFIRHQAG
jgi:hypothetical protein